MAGVHNDVRLRRGQGKEHPGVLRDGRAYLARHHGRLARAGGAQTHDGPVLLLAHVAGGLERRFLLGPCGAKSQSDVLGDLPLEEALQSVEPKGVLSACARRLLGGSSRGVGRRARVVFQAHLSAPELLDQGALASDERHRVLYVILCVSLVLHVFAHLVGGVPEVVQIGRDALPVLAQLQSQCLAAQAGRHSRGHLRHVKVVELAERNVQHDPLAEELVVVAPDGVHGHELFPAHRVVVCELPLRHVLLLLWPLLPECLQPPCDGALVCGFPEKLQKAHVLPAP
eukprot:9504001-Pyramimonas_sp.AAC.8